MTHERLANKTETDCDVSEQFGSVRMVNPSFGRPQGVKRKKLEKTMERNITKVARSVDAMTETLKNSASSRKKAASIALQLKILHQMSPSPTDLNDRLEKLMMKSADLGDFKQTGSQKESASHGEILTVTVRDPNSPRKSRIENTSSYQFLSEEDQDDPVDVGNDYLNSISLITKTSVPVADAHNRSQTPRAENGKHGDSKAFRRGAGSGEEPETPKVAMGLPKASIGFQSRA